MNAVFSEIKYEDLENISHDALDAAWRKWLTTETYNNVIGLDQFKNSHFLLEQLMLSVNLFVGIRITELE